MLRTYSGAALMLFTAHTLGAQIVQNTVTVTASANPNVQADQINIVLDVMSGIQTGLNDVLAELQGIGVTIANFTGIRTGPGLVSLPVMQAPPSIDWYFSMQTPTTQLTRTLAAITALQATLARNKTGMTLSSSVQGTTVSQQLAQSQTCSLPGLIASAKTQAQTLTAAAGLTLGNIAAISGASVLSTTAGSSNITDTSPCSLTVKFAVLRYQ